MLRNMEFRLKLDARPWARRLLIALALAVALALWLVAGIVPHTLALMLVYGAGLLSAMAAGLVVLEIGIIVGRRSGQVAVVPPPADFVAPPAPVPRNLRWRAQNTPRPEDYSARLAFGAFGSLLRPTSSRFQSLASEQSEKVLVQR